MVTYAKSVRCMIFMVVVMMLLTGCSVDTAKYQPNEDPEPYDYLHSFLPGVEYENEYDQIHVELEAERYPIGTESISCRLINENVGKGFYFYEIPYLEKYTDGEWVRYSYYPPATQTELSSWLFCAIEGNETKPNSTVVTFYLEYVQEKITEGMYRLVFFVGPNTYYGEFELYK